MEDKRCECAYVTKAEFDAFKTDVEDLARNVSTFVTSIDKNMSALITALSGKTPEGSVPIQTHNMVVKGLISVFTVVILTAIGAVKLLPEILK